MEIIAEMMEDTVEIYKGGKIPFVIESDHPRFSNGTRLDWGFLQVAIEDGYAVTIKPFKINRSNCEHPEGFRKTCIIRGFKNEEREYICPICKATQYIQKEEDNPEWIIIDEIIERRLERVATERKDNKIEADLDGRHTTRKTVLVDEIKIDSTISKSKEDGYTFYHNNNYVSNYTSLDAKVIKKNDRDILYITPNGKSPNDDG